MSTVQSQVHSTSTVIQYWKGASYRGLHLQRHAAEYNAVAEAYHESGFHRHVARLSECRTDAFFYRNRHTGLVRVGAKSCHVRFCPFCSSARTEVIRRSTLEWLTATRHPKFITLTLKHSDTPLSEQLDRLYSSFKELKRNDIWHKKITSAVWFFEVKRSKSGQWHPHLHILADGAFLGWKALCRAWLRVTGDSSVVDVRAVKDPSEVAAYVSKYATKPASLASLSLEDRCEILAALRRRRTAGTVNLRRKFRLCPCKPSDSADWINVGSWRTVIENLGQIQAADDIFNAWRDGSPCPLSLDLWHMDCFIKGWNPIDFEHRRPEQLNLW